MSVPPGDPSSTELPTEVPTAADISTLSLENPTAVVDFASNDAPDPPRSSAIRTNSDPPKLPTMTTSSSPLGNLSAARRPGPSQPPLASVKSGAIQGDVMAKMKAFAQSRQGAPPARPGGPTAGSNTPISPLGQLPSGFAAPGLTGSPRTPLGAGGVIPGGLRLPQAARPPNLPHSSAPAVPNVRSKGMSLAAKRGLGRPMKLTDATGPTPAPESGTSNTGLTLGGNDAPNGAGQTESMFTKYSEFVDTATGTLKFKGKATIHGGGIEFSSGQSFNISLDEVDTLEELGKGNYGTVYQVRHARPQIRRPGLGLKGNKAPSMMSMHRNSSPTIPPLPDSPEDARKKAVTSPVGNQGGTTGLIMAMKEIRLELDEAKFAAIIMELDILHRCVSPFIVDFYGAFFQEGAVYICMEFMDGGSIDKLYGDGIPENVLRKIVLSAVMGLKSLKDDHNIIHRDVKPTNILVNRRGQVKICDFGVSGNLVASIAKTNIGCQSYMAPERIKSGGVASAGANPGGGTYSVQSDVWSLGLTAIECAMGQYPYPPETYNNIFSQLSVSLSDSFHSPSSESVRS